MHAKNDGSYGYEMEIIVKDDSPIQSPSEIKGKTLAFTSPTSNSGFKAPSAILKGEFDLIADRDFTPTFSGKHDNNIYENKKFYKIINYPQIRFIHGGVNPENKSYIERKQNLNKTSPTIPLEIKFKEEIKPRYNYQIKNPSETVNLVNTFESGSIAMVKSGKDKSSSTEFFFVTTKIPELDGRYSIFGKIIKGLDVLEKINKEDYIKAVLISN